MKVLILHGVGGYAGKHWMQWLHDWLIYNKDEVIMPSLPNSENPAYKDWIIPLKDIFNQINNLNELTIVGHSMGVPAALEIVQNLDMSIKGLISAGGFYQDYGSPINTKFMSTCNIDIEKAKNRIENSVVFYGDNDPYVPQEILSNLAKGLGVEPVIIKNGGHLNTEAGFTKFELMKEYLQKLIK